MMWGYGYGFNWLGMALMMIGSLLWIVLLVVIVWALIRWLNHQMRGSIWPTNMIHGSSPTAMDILRQRYARGEIDAVTFEQMRERIEASTAPQPDSRPFTGVR